MLTFPLGNRDVYSQKFSQKLYKKMLSSKNICKTRLKKMKTLKMHKRHVEDVLKNGSCPESQRRCYIASQSWDTF